MGIPLTKIKGIGPNTERLLRAYSINSVEDLAAAPIESLSDVPGFSEARARQFQQAAIDVLANWHAVPSPQIDKTSVPIAEPVSIPESISAAVSVPQPSSPTDLAPPTIARLNTAPSQSAVELLAPKDAIVAVTTSESIAESVSQPVTTEVAAPLEEAESATVRGRPRRRRRGPAPINSNNAQVGIGEGKPSRRPAVATSPLVRAPHAAMEVEPRTRITLSTSRDLSMPVQTQMNTCTMALFCDFENIALGARDAHYAAFDIQKVLERLLLKGNIVVRKAYCDWERYKEFKAPMHEAAFELIEIPHLRQSGKNSADIRMVVDALDLCYTKQHLDTFVIISGDSDFTSLVTKLRENNKTVIGIGVKKSTSDLFTSNCDEFIFYDDLLRESEKEKQRHKQHDKGVATARSAPKVSPSQEEVKMQEALDLVLETVEDLFEERGGDEKVWGSMVKQAVKRRKPGFNERYHGFRTFSKLLEEAAARGLLHIQHDEKSGGYIIESL